MNKFWNWVKNEDSGETELYFDGPISEESWLNDEITPAKFKEELAHHTGDLTVWLNSPGGDVLAASQIYTMLKNHKGRITVKIDALAASAASVVAIDFTYWHDYVPQSSNFSDGKQGGHGKGNRAVGGSQRIDYQCL